MGVPAELSQIKQNKPTVYGQKWLWNLEQSTNLFSSQGRFAVMCDIGSYCKHY
jgi:hypothetical protein